MQPRVLELVEAEQRGDGGELGIAPDLAAVPFDGAHQTGPEIPAVQMQTAGEVAAELREVRADVILGEDQDVVAHARDERREQLLLDLLGVAREAIDQVVGQVEHPIHDLVVDPVLQLVAVVSAVGQVAAEHPLRGLLEHASHRPRVPEPEDRGEVATVAGGRDVLRGAREQLPIALPGSLERAGVERSALLDRQLDLFLLEDVGLERLLQGG